MAKLRTVKVVHPSSNKHWLLINEIDFQDGVHRLWEDKPAVDEHPDPAPKPPPRTVDPKASREAELNGLDWREIKAIAESFEPPIEKPDGGWDEAISLIVEREFPAD